MAEFLILRDVGYVVIAAAVLLLAARPLRVPAILAYMLGGLLLGPVTGLLGVSASLELLSHLGTALLLFVVGLELQVGRIRDVGRAAVVGGVLQVAVTFGLGAGLALALGFEPAAAAFLGLAAAFSSTVVVVKMLDRAGELGSLHGRLAIGVLLVQDVLVAVVITLVGGLGAGGGGAGAVARGLATAFLGIGALSVVAALAVRWVVPRVLGWLAESPEALFVASLAWAFGFIVAAEALHVSIELGAFIAGIALAQLPYNDELRRRVHPLVDFFLAVFFVTLGARMDPAAAAQHWVAAVLLSAFVLLGKPVLTAWILGRAGASARASFLAGLTLGQVSEFAFILTTMAVAGGLVGDEILSLVGVVGLVTIGVSTLLVPRGAALFRACARRGLLRFLPPPGDEPAAAPARRGHVVVIGMNALGRLLVEELVAMGEEVLAVDTDTAKLRGLPAAVLHGSVENQEVLQHADLERAKLVVSALQIEDVNSFIAYRCSRLGVPVSIHAFDPSLADELLEIGADHLMVSKHDGIRQMAEQFRRHGVVG